MKSFPHEVSDTEIIIRGICSPYHVSSNGKLKSSAFDPTPGTDEVSVMRHDWIGTEACRDRSKNLADPGKNKIYRGMAILTAASIRQAGADIIDSRIHFPGHADIKHGFVTQIGEPPSAAVLHALRSRTKLLAKMANFFVDPEPDSISWQGLPLCFSANNPN